MSGRRFAAGTLAGLALGFVIIGVSGFTNGNFASFTFSSSDLLTYNTTVTSTATRQMTSADAAHQTGSNQSAASISTPFYAFFGDNAGRSEPPSRLDAIAGQPVVVTGVMAVPLLGAVLAGAALYLRTRSHQAEEAGNGTESS